MKQVEFDIELVKKIQAGEVKGFIKTRDGNDARFLGEINDPIYSLVFAIKESNCKNEFLNIYTTTGKSGTSCHTYYKYDIILEIEDEQKKPEHQFKPFDKVLVRDSENEEWKADFFSRYYTDYRYDYECVSGAYIQCIPYEGNQDLVGTTKTPKDYGGK